MSNDQAHMQPWESTSTQGLNMRVIKDLWAYRYLIVGLAWNNLVASHRQTLLGWFWVLAKPLLMVLIYLLLFVKIFRISTNGIPPFLFYLAGNTLWHLFSDIFSSSASTIAGNASTWNKVYYPRLVSPISSVLHTLLMFTGQFLIFLIAWTYYVSIGMVQLHWMQLPWAVLALIIQLMLALGTGLIISVISVRYRDLNMLSTVAIRALFFVTPVLYSWDRIPDKWQWIAWVNPLAGVFELFRYAFLNGNFPPPLMLGLSAISACILLLTGIQLFLKRSTDLLEYA